MPDGWRVEIVKMPPAAEITPGVRKELGGLLEELEETGTIQGCEPMAGYRNWYKCRFVNGRWRLVFEVNRGSRFIRIISIGPRGSAYAGLKHGRRN